MKIRGRRECTDCGATWSYYETGSVTCPDCGSVESVGIDDERQLHTASPAELDLTPVRADVDAVPLAELAEAARERCREHVREQGFLGGGDLLALDDTYLAAAELAHVADHVDHSMAVADAEEHYLLELLGGADAGERPAADAVPDGLRAARGLAVADAVGDYGRAIRTWLDEHPHPEVRDVLERLDDHVRRIEALQGDVPPAESERLVGAARDLGTYLRADDEAGLDAAHSRLADLA